MKAQYIPLLYIAGAVAGLMVINSIITNIKGPTVPEPPIPDPYTVPKSNGVTCKVSYPQNIAASLFVKLAKQIYEAKGVFNDDEAAVYSAINQLRTRGDFYVLNGTFNNLYKSDMVQYIRGFLSAEEFLPIATRLSKLPCNI
jgi:hypothetical protein